MPKRLCIIGTLVLSLLVSACGGTPQPKLTSIGQVIPADVSFAGRWALRDAGDDSAGQIRNAEHAGAGGLDDVIARARQDRHRGTGRSKNSPSVHVFLETGRDLKITQTEHGLFISFDRSVVEEYRYREHRPVNVGPIQAERASGWQDGQYVIKTADEQGAILTETYALEDDGQVLVRTFTIVYKEEETLSVRQVFDRQY